MAATSSSGSNTSPLPESSRICSPSETRSMASRRRRYLSLRHSLVSSTAERCRLPRNSLSLASNSSNRVKASAVAPAKPATILPSYRRRTLRAVCFMIMDWPRVTWPSPAMATCPSFLTARIVVACVSIIGLPRFPCVLCTPHPACGKPHCRRIFPSLPWPA